MSTVTRRAAPLAAAVAALLLSSGCAITHPPSVAREDAQLTPSTAATGDLRKLPPPKGKAVSYTHLTLPTIYSV